MNSTSIGSGGHGLLVTGNDRVYSYDDDSKQVNTWLGNATSSQPVMLFSSYCHGLFVDQNNTLYCSVAQMHQVVTKSLNDPSNTFAIVAGTGCVGSSPDMLYSPTGIFVHFNFALYVADAYNNRIQYFVNGNMSATTIAGNGAPNTIDLIRPMDIALDGDGYLFIVDSGQHRIIGSNSDGFRCVAGCTRTPGSGFHQFSSPQSISFDRDGNIWVADTENRRIQKFMLNNGPSSKFQVLFHARDNTNTEG